MDVRSPLRRVRRRVARATLPYRAVWPPTLGPGNVPETGVGRRVGPPDYVGIAAPRSGSSWVARLIDAHPGVAPRLPWGKELHFFDSHYGTDPADFVVTDYHRYFPRSEGEVIGEWTPGYLYLPWAPPLLTRAAPDALVLAVLRDPVEQIISSVNYSAHCGAPKNGIMVSRHLGEAAYHQHLRLWRSEVSNQMMVFQLEEAVDDPISVRGRIWEALGLDPAVEVQVFRRRNAGAAPSVEFSASTRRSMAELLEPDVLALTEAEPSIDPGRWPNFAHLG